MIKSAMLGMLMATAVVAAQSQRPRPTAVAQDPVSGIIRAFQAHQVVAIGEGTHGNEQGAQFRVSLIRNPRFASTVNDIVVEAGNALYQDVIDRFVSGRDVPAEMTGSQLSPKLCADEKYVNMRVTRFALVGIPSAFVERFRRLCTRLAAN